MENLKVIISKYHYAKKPALLVSLLLFVPLGIISVFYGIIIISKNFLYSIKILKEKKVKPYVICVGNLTTGGVGKTPIVCELANYCANELKKKTAVISRGYGAKLNNKNVNIIKDYTKTYYDDGAICGDEALLCAQNTKNCIVLTSKNRVEAAQLAYKNYGCEVVVLDDGFSNRKIKKDFTILTIDSKKQFSNGFLLPLGALREPLGESKRADYAVISNKGDENILENKKEILEKIKTKKSVICNFTQGGFNNIKNGLEVQINNKKVIAFCAIGQPQQFYNYLKKSLNLVYAETFCDHYSYTQDDIEKIVKKARELNIDTIITTQKDEVKIKQYVKNISAINFLSMKLCANFTDNGLFYALERGIKNET